MTFRNVDGPSEMLESGIAQFYSRILVVNSGKRQTRVDWKSARSQGHPQIKPANNQKQTSVDAVASQRCDDADKVGQIVTGVMSGIILLFTVISVVAFGIFLAYATVTGILFAFARQARPNTLANPVLVPSQTHASGD